MTGEHVLICRYAVLCCALSVCLCSSEPHQQLHTFERIQGKQQSDAVLAARKSSQRARTKEQIQTDCATPYATFGGISWPIEAEVSACEAVVQTLGGLSHGFRDGPKHRLHHGQVLHVLMCLKQSITCKQQVASGAALLYCT